MVPHIHPFRVEGFQGRLIGVIDLLIPTEKIFWNCSYGIKFLGPKIHTECKFIGENMLITKTKQCRSCNKSDFFLAVKGKFSVVEFLP